MTVKPGTPVNERPLSDAIRFKEAESLNRVHQRLYAPMKSAALKFEDEEKFELRKRSSDTTVSNFVNKKLRSPYRREDRLRFMNVVTDGLNNGDISFDTFDDFTLFFNSLFLLDEFDLSLYPDVVEYYVSRGEIVEVVNIVDDVVTNASNALGGFIDDQSVNDALRTLRLYEYDQNRESQYRAEHGSLDGFDELPLEIRAEFAGLSNALTPEEYEVYEEGIKYV